MTPSFLSLLFHIQLVLKVKQQVDASCCWVCHRVQRCSAKRTSWGILWCSMGLYKEMLLTIMVSQILYLTQLISEIKNIVTADNRLFSALWLPESGAKTLSITTFSITTLSIMAYLRHSVWLTLSIIDIRHNSTLNYSECR